MRLRPHNNIWIIQGGKWYPGEFLGYVGRGMVNTDSDLGYCKRVPRAAIKPRLKKEVSA